MLFGKQIKEEHIETGGTLMKVILDFPESKSEDALLIKEVQHIMTNALRAQIKSS